MSEHPEVSLKLIDLGENARTHFDETCLAELEASIRKDGVITPVLLTPRGNRFLLFGGERRFRAAQNAGLAAIPARILDVDDERAAELGLVDNLHRQALEALDEAAAYRRFLNTPGRTIDELAVVVCKDKRHLHQMLKLLLLISPAQELLRAGALPVHYAVTLASVPQDRQDTGLAKCYRRLFLHEGPPTRDDLAPLSELQAWIRTTVRIDPRSEDTRVLLPTLAAHVETIEAERKATILMVSTQIMHAAADRDDPHKPILAKSWKSVEDKPCRHTRPAVIVIGPGQGTTLDVCIAKKECSKHWPRPQTSPALSKVETAKAAAQRLAEQERQQQQQKAQEEWRTHGSAAALRVFAARTTTLTLDKRLFHQLVQHLLNDDEHLHRLVPKTSTLPRKRYPQALAVALAINASWSSSRLLALAKALGVPLAPADYETTGIPVNTTPADPRVRATKTSSRRNGRRPSSRRSTTSSTATQ